MSLTEQEREIVRLAQFAATRFLMRQPKCWRRFHEEDLRAFAMQEAFRYAPAHNPALSKLSTYIIRYVTGRLHNYLRDDLRKNPPMLSLDAPLERGDLGLELLVDPLDVEQEVTDHAEFCERLAWIVGQMPERPERERMAVQGLVVEGLSLGELADREGVTPSAVSQAQRRSIVHFRALQAPSAARREGERP